MSFDTTDYAPKKLERVKPTFKGGAQFGRVSQVINMGLQHQTMWNGGQSKKLYWKPKGEQEKGGENQTFIDTGEPVARVIFRVTVEFDGTRVFDTEGNDVGPAVLSKEYHPAAKALGVLLDGFEGNDVSTILGQAVMAVIGFTSGGNPKITTLSAAPDGTVVPELTATPLLFDYYNPSPEAYEALYPWLKEDLEKAMDYEGSNLQLMLSGPEQKAAGDDGGPF